VKGLFLCVNGYINAQDNPKDPKGTIISMTSGTAGMTYPTSSGYSVPKLAVQKFSELVHAGVFP
jgi:NADP-dependent 3-hydroxy acid dehydrogenase YdfG